MRYLPVLIAFVLGLAGGAGGYAALSDNNAPTTTCSREATGRIEVPSGDPQYKTVCVRR